MAEKNIKSRIVHKHDTESNWSKATTFIPKQGEIIIYDIDSNHSYERFKIGDGITKVNNLPFADANKVDKISGKGLSTNDYTTAEKNKLASIAEGANKTIVDSELSSTSTDPVQNKVVNAAINDLNTLIGDTAVSTQISDYAAPKSHTHNYAGSSSAAGAANVSESDIGITTAGTGSAYTATVPGITALTSGVSFVMVPHVVSASTTPTLNVNSLGAKNIKRRLSSISTSVQSGYSNTWLAKGTPFRVTYDGTQWTVEGLTKPAVADLYGTLSIEKGGTGATTATGALTNLGGVPTSRKINGHDLTADISLTASDVGAITGISGTDVIDALGYTPVNQANITYPIPMTKGGTGATKLEDVQKNILDGTYPAYGTDLSKLAPGIYGLPNDSNNVINAPVASWSPLAFVFGHQNNDIAADGSPTGGYFQGYLEWEGELWLRRRKWDGWGEWMKYYSTKNIIYSSTQPSNASTGTIWLKPV